MDNLYTCPTCGNVFDTRHTKDWTHCEDCGAHGKHECAGKVDWEKRGKRASRHLATRIMKWEIVGRDEKGRDILMMLDQTRYDYSA